MDLSVILKIAVVGLVTAISGMLLKKSGKDDIATVVSIAGLIVAIVFVVDMVGQLYQVVSQLFDGGL
ncbi:MAG: stage III sporulation AC/AD family protein [Clostridia bacterium]|nr:stage III sporulation AC/AD family protein [Clostridia bacterium]MBR2966572.1 stage III sporulation AC/AD family protein [Clostridia bacterium]